MDSKEELESWRREIREIDADLLKLVARRMELSLNIGNYKKQHQLPVKDYRVEKQIIEKARESALNLGLYPALAEDLMGTLIHYSVLRQDELIRSARQPTAQARQALIIGGAGRMGQWFSAFYESLGYETSICDTRATAAHYRVHDSLEAGLDAFDLIVLATPMREANQILIQLSQLRPKACILEICSLKAPVMEGLERALAAGLKLASIHPMFGPDTDVLAGKNIIFCTGKGYCSEEVLAAHFQQTSAHLLTLPIEAHDKMMSYALGAAHLINLIYAQVLVRSGEELSKLKAFGGTTFLEQLDVTDRVVAENQDLYFDIQRLNRATPQLLRNFLATLNDFTEAVGQERGQAFLDLMEEARRYFRAPVG